MAKRENPNQIIRIDGRNCFVEALNDSFPIGKVHLGFYAYDVSKAAGSRFTNNIQIYIDIAEFLSLAQDVGNGRFTYKAKQSLEKMGTGKYAEPIYKTMGGTSAKRLAAQGQARKDGMGISRQFKITPGTKMPYMLSAESGAGQEDDKGLIVPRYGTNPEQRVTVAMDANTLQRFALMVQMHIQSYYTAMYVVNPGICDKQSSPQENNPYQGGYGQPEPAEAAEYDYDQQDYGSSNSNIPDQNYNLSALLG